MKNRDLEETTEWDNGNGVKTLWGGASPSLYKSDIFSP